MKSSAAARYVEPAAETRDLLHVLAFGRPLHELLGEGLHAGIDGCGAAVRLDVVGAVGDVFGPEMRWPDRSMAKAAGSFWLTWTFAAASTHSSQVALGPGNGTPACSNSVLFAKPPVSVIWVINPVIDFEPSGRIQSNSLPKLACRVRRVLDVGRQIQPVLGDGFKVGHPRDVGPLPASSGIGSCSWTTL